jgi:hypothetical protein
VQGPRWSASTPRRSSGKYLPSGNAWVIFKTYLEEAARRTAQPVIAKYAGVLAAADVFTVDNAFAMIESPGQEVGRRRGEIARDDVEAGVVQGKGVFADAAAVVQDRRAGVAGEGRQGGLDVAGPVAARVPRVRAGHEGTP